jgi:outer membrane protein OmpU
MKRVLLATTMLVAGASIAAAEVTLSGEARMGIISNFGDDGDATNGDEGALGFTSRARVIFNMSGETDGGLSFGASFRADNAGDASDGNAGTVFISGAFGKLTIGDTDGAAKAAVGNVDGVGLTGLDDTNESFFLANGGIDLDDVLGFAPPINPPNGTSDQSALYEFSTGGLTLYVSATDPAYIGEDSDVTPTDFYEGTSYALGAKYTFDAYTLSLGYETLETGLAGAAVLDVDFEHLIVGASATFSGVTVKATYGKADGTILGTATDLTQYAMSANYKMDALSVTGFLNQRSADETGIAIIDQRAIGLGASYDLGGGASVVGGVARVKDDIAQTSDTAYDFGVSFKF